MDDTAFREGTYEYRSELGTATVHVPRDISAQEASRSLREMLKEVSESDREESDAALRQ